MKIYVHEHVKKIERLHKHIISSIDEQTNVLTLLNEFAENLFSGFEKGNRSVAIEIRNWHPDLICKDRDEILDGDFGMDDAKLTIARAYGFEDWKDAETRGNSTFNLEFERAIDTMLNGNIDSLKKILELNTGTLTERSPYGHGATLLHYAGSNGVEMWRQKVPLNLPEIVRFLIKKGTDKNATAKFYGGEFTTIDLAGTSAHPKDAGIMDDLLEALSD